MFKKHHALVFSCTALVTLTACAGKEIDDIGGQFWQRSSVSEAIYAQGPKAQQMLNRDISRCVVDLRELERLGTLKDAIPTDFQGRTLDPDEQELYDWDTPERNKHLYAEHSDYTDFESCMLEKGWERVEHAPFDVTRKGRENYLRAHVDYHDEVAEKMQKKSKRHPTSNDQGDYGDLND
ncbi:MAG: hypothetical protein H6861_06550 [Rhodospirillales bacterium]|nr:hypothetical protein [Rhodospirillales bacterium]